MAMFRKMSMFLKLCVKGQTRSFYEHNKSSLLFVHSEKNITIAKNYCSQIQNDNSLTEEQLTLLTDNNPETEKKLKILMLEADVHRQEGGRVPEMAQMKQQHWEQLLALPTRSGRRKYLSFLWQIERKKENNEAKKEIAKQYREERYEQLIEDRNQIDEDDADNKYGLHRNTMFLRIYDSTINQMLNNRLVQAIRFGQPLVLDCSFDEHMTSREAVNTAKQLMLLFAENRAHDQPFDLHYCNAKMSGIVMKQLHRNIGTLKEPWFPLHIHQDSYLDHFPKDRLVYLTPHCRTDLVEFNHDDVYIIGAMVDKANSEPLSLGKAKEHGIRVARLPLERYLSWGSGSGKSLTLNQMCSILLDLRHTGNWDIALKNVPKRKVYRDENNFVQKFNRYENNQMFNRKQKVTQTYDKETFILDFDEDNDKRKIKNNFDIKKWGASKNSRTDSNSKTDYNDDKKYNKRKQNGERVRKPMLVDIFKD